MSKEKYTYKIAPENSPLVFFHTPVSGTRGQTGSELRRKTSHVKQQLSLLFILVLFWGKANAQHDSLILKNGDVIVGEVKSMDKGVLGIETPYSDKDFIVKWSGLKEIYSKTIFLVTLSDGRRVNGRIQSEPGGKMTGITTLDSQKIIVGLDDIVFLKGLKSDFWSRVKATADVGLNFAKANNLNQLIINTYAGYLAQKWQLDLYYSMTRSAQDSVETTKRTDAGISFKYYLPKDWYLAASLNFLSNTEQALHLRTIGKLGAGKFLIHTNKTYWGAGAGISFNNESFTNGFEDRSSIEAYVGTEVNMFNTGDLSLLSSLYVYPGITESGRLRSDFKIDSKYDLPLDFYLKLGLTVNYDNRPAVVGKETDYVLAFTIGWEL